MCRVQRVLPTCNGGEWIRKYVSTLVAHVIASCCSSSSTSTTSNGGCNRCGVWCCMCNQSTHHFVLAIRLRFNQLTDELQQRYHRVCIEETAKEKEEVEEEEEEEEQREDTHCREDTLSDAFYPHFDLLIGAVATCSASVGRESINVVYVTWVCVCVCVSVPSLYMYIGKNTHKGTEFCCANSSPCLDNCILPER